LRAAKLFAISGSSYVVHGTRSRGDDNVILVLTAIGSRQLT
jgi:hypothetical protein